SAEAPDASPSTQVIVAGKRYGSGGFQQFFLGAGYRKTWTTPVRVPVLDLGGFGGLTPTRTGGGNSTISLRLHSGDGRRFKFRLVDKDTTAVVPEDLRDTAAEWVIQDQTGSMYPVAALMVDSLRTALGMLYVPRTLYVMPDDPRLGEFRAQFKGQLGMLEEMPRIKAPVTPGFEDVTEILETAELLPRLDGSAEEIDAQAFLKCRMLDFVIGDWDRHPKQWVWVRREGHPEWLPYVADTDMAFSDYGGLIATLARPSLPITVTFDPSHKKILGLAWDSREIDRRMLAEMERPAYLQAAAEVQRGLTDAAIEEAVRQLPPEYYAVDGKKLTTRLKQRRDRLQDSAARFYELLAHKLEIYGRDQADVAQIDRSERDDSMEVRLTHAGDAEPYYRRRVLQADTDEVRLYLKGGDDRVTTLGRGAGGIKLRVIGGAGDDVLDDANGGRTQFYDHEGHNQVVPGQHTHFDRRAYERPLDSRGYQKLDWGGFRLVFPEISYSGDVGLVTGAKVDITRFGFRDDPWSSRHQIGAVYAFGRQGGRIDYLGQWQQSNSARRLGLFARVSDIEIVRFFGFGNQSENTGVEDFYKSDQRQYLFEPAFRLGLRGVDVWVGPRLKYQKTDLDPDTFIGVTQPYGSDNFGAVGANVHISADTRPRVDGLGRGVRVAVAGNYYPQVWSVESGFGEVHGEVAGYLHLLALRAGGKKVWGTFPFYEAAFLGGPTTLRSARRERYAGDATVFGSAELRLPLVRFNVLMPIRAGVFGLADVGRVYVDGSSPGGWHKGFGGGAWFSFIKPENTLTIAAAVDPDAQGDDGKTRIYFQAGFGF
ncbi:MAG TPA: hypothetical protein VFK70_13885, partial [Vicinamibacteria bacterium]|nr:hypothetical protein [Vicinamibacteria bacterium]